MVWQNHQNFTSLPGNLFLHSTPKGEDEDLLLVIVPKAHWTGALNGCHQDAGHQDHDHTLSLLQEHFWWPGMAKQMRQVIKACRCCLQYEGGTPKAPLCPIVATAPLDLLHVDFTSIETMMELDKSPLVANVLVFQDHFTKHVLAYVTPDQTVKTVTKFLYGGYISIFGALARLLSDWGTSFTSSIIEELCKILGIQWLCTSPTPCKTTSVRGDEEMMPQEQDGKVVTWQPTSKASLGWKNGKLQLGSWTSTGASTEDGWRPQVKWFGCRPLEEHICKAEGWCLYPLMLADSEPKEECYHSLNWVTADKANQMKWRGEWNRQAAPMSGWRVKGLPPWCKMLLPTKRYLHWLWRDGFIPFKAAKQKWQQSKNNRAQGCAPLKNGGFVHTDPLKPFIWLSLQIAITYSKLVMTIVHMRKLIS